MASTDIIAGCHFGKDKKMGLPDVIRSLFAHFGADCGQIFVGSPQSPNMSDSLVAKWMEEAKEIKRARDECGGFKLYVHAPYTLNFCMEGTGQSSRGLNSDMYWIKALMMRMRIAEAMGAEGCVLHMGKAVKLSVSRAEDVFHENVCVVLDAMREEGLGVKLIIETSAGQGTELYPTTNNTLEDLARFWRRFSPTQKRHLGLCVDTCHIFAAGFDIGTEKGNTEFWKQWVEMLGIESMSVVHMNNSMKGLGSRVDRHAPLASGAIGLPGLAAFAKSAALYNIPMVIETPLCQYDIEVLDDFVTKDLSTINNRDWEAWFKERHLNAMFQGLGI
jgi:deoxyribonuclease IV